MSNLPGNPYADALTDYTDPRNSIEALATLALAYEQRTANLIAALHLQAVNHQADIHLMEGPADMLNERLGLDGTK